MIIKIGNESNASKIQYWRFFIGRESMFEMDAQMLKKSKHALSRNKECLVWLMDADRWWILRRKTGLCSVSCEVELILYGVHMQEASSKRSFSIFRVFPLVCFINSTLYSRICFWGSDVHISSCFHGLHNSLSIISFHYSFLLFCIYYFVL